MKNGEHPPAYYPIFLNITGKKCVVVGGGQIALRKVRTLLDYGASVRVISPELCSELNKMAENGAINIQQRRYRSGDLQEAFVVIAATNDSTINLKVGKDARSNALLVNVVDAPESSGFIAPSYVRRGDVTIAISSGGRSPALSQKIRTKLEEDFGEEYISLARMISEVRTDIKRQGIKVSSNAWQEALDLDLLVDLVKKGDNEKAKAFLLSSLKKRQKRLLR